MNTQTLFSHLIRTGHAVNGEAVWHARVDLTVLRNMLSSSSGKQEDNRQWAFPLPEAKTALLRTYHVEPVEHEGRIWYGENPICPGLQSLLVVHRWNSSCPVLSGHIHEGARFQIRDVTHGLVSICRVPVLRRPTGGQTEGWRAPPDEDNMGLA